MTKLRINLAVIGFAIVITAATSAYYAFLHAPAAIAARPQLAELGFGTALFSGRFMVWLFYHEPLIGTGIVGAFWMAFAVVVLWNV